MTEFKWSVAGLQVKQLEEAADVICRVDWRLDAIGEVFSSATTGTVELDTADLTEFTAFEDITEEQTIQWVINTMGKETIDTFKTRLIAQIDEQVKRAAIVYKQPPWIINP